MFSKVPTKIILGPDGFSGQIYQPLKEEITPILHNFCSEKGTHFLPFVASVTLITTLKQILPKNVQINIHINIETNTFSKILAN